MLEDCKSINQCEDKLAPKVNNVTLLGEIELNPHDLDILERLVNEKTKDDFPKGIKYLKEKAPTCLSLFLVWKGISNYKNGDYWSAVGDSLNPQISNWQNLLGKSFFNFLKDKNLPIYEFRDSHRFVGTLLLHGLIPNDCLDEFFKQVVEKWTEQKLANPDSSKETLSLLKIKRSNQWERKNSQKKIKELEESKEKISNEQSIHKKLIRAWSDLANLHQLEKSTKDFQKPDSLPEDPIDHFTQGQKRSKKLQKEIEELKSKKKELEKDISKFRDEDEIVLEHLDRIQQLADNLQEFKKRRIRTEELEDKRQSIQKEIKQLTDELFDKSWKEKFCKSLIELDLGKLEALVDSLESRKNEGGFWRYFTKLISQLVSRPFFKINRPQSELKQQIKDHLNNLPIKEEKIDSPGEELLEALQNLKPKANELSQLKEKANSLADKNNNYEDEIKLITKKVQVNSEKPTEKVKELTERLKEAKRRQKIAGEAKRKIEEINKKISNKESIQEEVNQKLNEIETYLRSLGDGDLKRGIESFKELRKDQKKKEKLRDKLDSKFSNLSELRKYKKRARKQDKNKQYYISQVEKENKNLNQINGKITEHKDKLQNIPEPLSYVDKPIRRFLIYGGEIAKNFLVHSIKLLNQAKRGEKLPNSKETKLPQRVVESFKQWWEKRESEGGPGPIEDYPRPFLRRPIISLTFPGGVIANIPPQRLKKSNSVPRLSLELNDKYLEELKVYRLGEENIILSEELQEYHLSPGDKFEFTLKTNEDEIRSWRFRGLTKEKPFLAFDNSKKLITNKKLPNEIIWIVIQKSTSIQPESVIRAQTSLSGKWSDYKALQLDLNNVDEIKLFDQQNETHLIETTQETEIEPELKGTSFELVSSEGYEVFTKTPFTIEIPLRGKGELKSWDLSIFNRSNNTLKEAKYLRLSEIKESVNCDLNKDTCHIPLTDSQTLGKEPVGSFRVRIRNSNRDIEKDFEFLYLPSLDFNFEEKLYLPSEDESVVNLNLETSRKADLDLQSQAQVVQSEKSHFHLQTETTEENIKGVISLTSLDISFPLKIKIPRLTWRIKGAEEEKYSEKSCKLKEVWFGHWVETEATILIVEMPSWIKNNIRLKLKDPEQDVIKELDQGKATFDLLRFSDTIGQSEKDLLTFQVNILDHEKVPDTIDLFHLRTRWKAYNIETTVKSSEETRTLEADWNEKGQVKGKKKCILWALENEEKINEESLNKEVKQVEFSLPHKVFSPGKYLLQIKQTVPWSATASGMPETGSKNTKIITVEEDSEAIEDIFPVVISPGSKAKDPYLREKREGGGFSKPEIREAGLTVDRVRGSGLRCDPRRRSCHSWNVERLKKVKDKLEGE